MPHVDGIRPQPQLLKNGLVQRRVQAGTAVGGGQHQEQEKHRHGQVRQVEMGAHRVRHHQGHHHPGACKAGPQAVLAVQAVGRHAEREAQQAPCKAVVVVVPVGICQTY